VGVLVAFACGTLLFLTLLWFAARGAITICILEVHRGEVVVTQGGLAPRILSDLGDVVRRPRVSGATVRIVRAKDRAGLEAKGDVSPEQLQQMRNIVGSVPLGKLTNTRSKAKKAR
jgi:hypothetical protein